MEKVQKLGNYDFQLFLNLNKTIETSRGGSPQEEIIV